MLDQDPTPDVEGIARDLHDGAAQELWLARLKLERLQATLETSDGRALAQEALAAVATAASGLASTIEALRGGPTVGSPASARPSQRAASAEGVSARRIRDATGRVDVELLAIVREAATNVVKHAGATRIEVVSRRRGGVVEVRLGDNGRGFDTRARSRGHGLRGMVERARTFKGQVRIASRPGRGTSVVIDVPVGVAATVVRSP